MSSGREKVDVIVPIHQMPDVHNFLGGLSNESSFIGSLLLIVSKSDEMTDGDMCISEELFQRLAIKYNLSIRCFFSDQPLYPGAARNIGLSMVESNYIAFLDVNTLPPAQWLQASLHALKRDGSDLILGTTQYMPIRKSHSYIIAATYGFLPLRTLPGTVMKSSCLQVIGHFLPDIRAAEDIDYLHRIKVLMKGHVSISLNPCVYHLREGLISYFRKWIRNYSQCAPYPALYNQSFLLNLVLSILLLCIAYNWNQTIANWNENSYLYINNITKIVASILAIIYAVFRVSIPAILRHSFDHGRLLYIELPLLISIALVFDIAKVIGFFIRPLKVISARLSLKKR